MLTGRYAPRRQLALLSPDGLRNGRLATRALSPGARSRDSPVLGDAYRVACAPRTTLALRRPARRRSRSALASLGGQQTRSASPPSTADRSRSFSLGSLRTLLRSVPPPLAAPFPPLPASPGFTPFYLPRTPSRRSGCVWNTGLFRSSFGRLLAAPGLGMLRRSAPQHRARRRSAGLVPGDPISLSVTRPARPPFP